jgi:hypothetical protein
MSISPEVCDTGTPIVGTALPSAVATLPAEDAHMEHFDG